MRTSDTKVAAVATVIILEMATRAYEIAVFICGRLENANW